MVPGDLPAVRGCGLSWSYSIFLMIKPIWFLLITKNTGLNSFSAKSISLEVSLILAFILYAIFQLFPSSYILRKTIEGYLDSVPSLTSNTIKTCLIMHAFHSSRHLQPNGCFISVTLQWFKYSANPNGSTLYTEKSQTFKNDWNPFLSFVFHIDWLQNHRWLSV